MNLPAEVGQPQVRTNVHAVDEGGTLFWRVLAWGALGVALVGLGFLVDEPMTRLLTLGGSSGWQGVANFASKLGEGWVVGFAGAIISTVMFLKRRYEVSRGVFLIGFTGLITGLAATALRSLLGRTRPDSSVPQGFYGVWHNSHWIIGRYEFGSCPSGHTATAMAVAVALWLLYPRVGRFTFLYAWIVGWSRIAMGCHHFSDVVAAAVFGTFGAYSLLTWLEPRFKLWTQGLERKAT
jgi:membrane-associated phospholipid phosphatase